MNISDFEIAYKLTLGNEGEYSDDPNDDGGETYKGIARKKRPDWKGWILIDAKKGNGFPKNLDSDPVIQQSVKDFYKKEYWDINRLGELDQPIANECYDTGVNQGVKTATIYLQESLNLLNNNEAHYSDIIADGQIGDGTLKAYNAYINTFIQFRSRTKEKNIIVLLKCLNGLQFLKYDQIITNNPKEEIFFYGWISTRI